MKPREKKKIRFAAAAVLLLFGAHFFLGGVVLCIGDDGHVELEVSSEGACADSGTSAAAAHEPQQNKPSIKLISEIDSHCGSCSDLELSSCEQEKELRTNSVKMAGLVKGSKVSPFRPALLKVKPCSLRVALHAPNWDPATIQLII